MHCRIDLLLTHPNAGPRTKHASNMPMYIGADVLETLSSSSVVPSVVRAAAPIPWRICAAMNTYLTGIGREGGGMKLTISPNVTNVQAW